MQTRQVVLRERCAPVSVFMRRRRFLLGATATPELAIPPRARAVRLVAVCGFLVAMSASSARACIQAGGCDGFGVGGTPATVQRADFDVWITQNATQYCNSGVPLPFDTVNDADCFFGHTLEGLSNFCCPAELTIHLKAGPSAPGTDALRLVYQGVGLPAITTRPFAWSISLSALDGMALCTHNNANVHNGTWEAGEDMTCVLNLCKLPPDANGTTSVETEIRGRGGLDVFVEDDTGVDCIGLCNNICSCIPPPSHLAHWWPLDESAGSTAHDIAAGHNGITQPGPINLGGPISVVGKVAGAFSTGGPNGAYVWVQGAPDLDITSSGFTVDFWYRCSADRDCLVPPGKETVVSKMDATGAGYEIQVGPLGYCWGVGTPSYGL